MSNQTIVAGAAPQPAPGRVYVSFSAEIVPKTVEPLLGLCANLANQKVPEVYLMLSTPGGSVMHGINAYNVLRAMPFRLITHNVGNVDSIGNVLFLAGSERFSCQDATFMFHGVGFDTQGPTRLQEGNLREHLNSILADQKRIGAIIAAHTSLSPQKIKKLFLAAVTRDPHYAKANGIIHDIRQAVVPPGAPVHQLIFQR